LKGRTKKEKVGVQDIAKVLKISASTVSRALNDHPRISKETKERVKQAASRLGYNPGVPELMNPEKAEVIAVLVPSLERSLYREIIAGINRHLNETGYRLFVVDTQGSKDAVTSFFKTYRKFGISGIIHIVSDRTISTDAYSIIKSDTLPFVTVCEPEEETELCTVLPDMFQGVDKIVNYLKSLDVKNITLLLEDENKPEDYHLASTFEMVLETSANNNKGLSVYHFNKEDDRFMKEVETLLRNNNNTQAFIVKDTFSALEVLALTNRLGIRVPEDLLLVAIGTDYKLEGLTANLSLLKLPGQQMGYEAAELIFEQLKNPGMEKKSAIIPVSFILKGSAIRMKKE
jgi:LacI family transcriptional regulator